MIKYLNNGWEGEPQQYGQTVNVYFQGDVIDLEGWVEDALVPTLKKVGNRDTQVIIHYGG